MDDGLAKLIKQHEGCILTAYQDSVGVWTLGYGHNLSKPISKRAAEVIFDDDLNEAINDCLHSFPWFADLAQPRQWVLVDMCFNLGLTRLLKFSKMLKAIEAGDYEMAAAEMLNSRWAEQVSGRAITLAAFMRGSAPSA